MAAGFLFKTEGLSWPQALFILGAVVTACSTLAFAVRFSKADEDAVRAEMRERELAAAEAVDAEVVTEAA